MFGSLLRDFEDDPFFSSTSDPFQAHNERMRQMLRSFSDPFGHGFTPSITDGRDRGRRGRDQPNASVAHHSDHREMDLFRNPFATMDNMMADMRNRMGNMHQNLENISTDANTHAFSSSSVMTYSKVGNEPPKVFQASTQMRCAPGGIRETRRALKDSESGVEKMSIGHHIQDRGHVIERKHNQKTGEKELNQDFQNMDETEAQSFDEEWQRELSKFQPTAPMSRLEAPKQRAVHRAAIAGPDNTQREKDDAAESKKKTHVSELKIQGSSMKKK
ncbi:myeloid leukemia factor 1 isoform X1 [Pygocentrus nattereri]|uniref:myeloid leukemia factor 1 isoform X1 n=1 Tax=Pygocentrus nattereri TaxID=42514 RepID=UPI0008145D28|nr:myeloid leukemia factor 1 isoform X1 [Pygocentrus nattereri]